MIVKVTSKHQVIIPARVLDGRVKNGGTEVFASNQTIGEAHAPVQHRCGVSKTDAHAALPDASRRGLVAGRDGRSIVCALQAPSAPGLSDQLIVDDYSRANLEILALVRSMATLPEVHLD